MTEEQPTAKAYIFSLYPWENEAIDAFANAKCRGNRSEALRQMVALAVLNARAQKAHEAAAQLVEQSAY
jgi:hypothetical protein